MSQTRQETSSNVIFRSILIGGFSGGVEVLANHPFWTMKTRRQNREPFTVKRTVLYRGLIPNAASMMPITAIQVGLNEVFKQVFFSHEPMNDVQKTACAFAAGAASAAVACPTERIMTQQGKTGFRFIPTAQWIVQQSSMRSLFNGMVSTAIRDGVFTAAFITGSPIIKPYITPYCENNFISSVAAGMSSGLIAMVGSQAADNIKTAQQSAHPKQPTQFNDAIKKIYSESGAVGFFKGAGWRGLRIMSAVTIMSTIKETIEARFV